MMSQMQIHNFIQGSDEWLAHRANCYNASEAAAMLGLCKKTSRNELIKLYATGTTKEFSDFVKNVIFEKGHETEKKMRPIIEGIIGEELYPASASIESGLSRRYGVSFDGIDMLYTVIYEHKQWNEELAALVRAGIVPDTHMPQPQQQLMVSGALKVIFVVSDGTPEKMVSCDVYPDQAWFDRIKAGWAQFEKDVAAYVPQEVIPKAVAETMMDLPALFIQTEGEIAIRSNLDVFGEKLDMFVRGLNLKPVTDQDFANADAAVKVLTKAEEALAAGEANALAQASEIDALRRTVAAFKKTARDTRLMLEKLVKEEKQNRKAMIITIGRAAFTAHQSDLDESVAPIRLNLKDPDFVAATHGLKTLTSIQNAVDTCLANAKIEADATARDIRAKLDWCKANANGYGMLFPDLQQIIFKPAEDFQLVINTRIREHKEAEEHRLEQERARIRAEEEARARAEAEAKAKDPVEAVNDVLSDTYKEVVTASVMSSVETGSAVVVQQYEGTTITATHVPTQDIIDTGNKLKLGEVCSMLGFTVTEAFLKKLGFEGTRERNSVTYRECDFSLICYGITKHVQQVHNDHMNKLQAAA